MTTSLDIIDILLVEDNPGDVLLTRQGLVDAKMNNELHVVADGKLALEYLRRQGDYGNAKTPDIVLLDLNLPRMNGIEVLQEIRSDSMLQNIPVVVLTSSLAEEDIVRSYSLHANCYVTKPVDFDRFVEVVRAIEEFWFTIVRLPARTP